MEIINFEALGIFAIAAFVLAKLVQAVKDRMGPRWENLGDQGKEFAGYGIIVVSAGLLWLTGLDFLPGFDSVVPWAGRVLSCIIGGFGPTLVYDIWLDKPAPLEP